MDVKKIFWKDSEDWYGVCFQNKIKQKTISSKIELFLPYLSEKLY